MGVEVPNVVRAKASLSRFVSAKIVGEVWSEACRDAGIEDDSQIDLATLRVIVARVEREPGILGLSAAALRVRIDAYLALEAETMRGLP